jgi:hypothetical protein
MVAGDNGVEKCAIAQIRPSLTFNAFGPGNPPLTFDTLVELRLSPCLRPGGGLDGIGHCLSRGGSQQDGLQGITSCVLHRIVFAMTSVLRLAMVS